ncbi:MAG: hypothetical protein ACREFP_24500 [Acetobacteraceae bacterium]
MSRISDERARHLAVAGVEDSVLAALVADTAAARAAAINREGLQVRITYPLEADRSGEIESLAIGNQTHEGQT